MADDGSPRRHRRRKSKATDGAGESGGEGDGEAHRRHGKKKGKRRRRTHGDDGGGGGGDGATDFLISLEEVTDVDARALASGTYGDVFVATCRGLKAVKCLRPSNSGGGVSPQGGASGAGGSLSLEDVRGFVNEVRILATVVHDNICPFVGACCEPPNLFIVLEYMAGGNLFDRLRAADAAVISHAQKFDWMHQLASAMNYLHSLDPPIAHRDLKTPNILLDGLDVLKVTDFGVSRVKQADEDVLTTITGSPIWMSPEILRSESYGLSADVYSYALIVYEVLTHELPYAEFKSKIELIRAVGMDGRRPEFAPRNDDEAVSPAVLMLERVMREAWEQDPGSRPSFGEVVATLDEVVDEVVAAGL